MGEATCWLQLCRRLRQGWVTMGDSHAIHRQGVGRGGVGGQGETLPLPPESSVQQLWEEQASPLLPWAPPSWAAGQQPLLPRRPHPTTEL